MEPSGDFIRSNFLWVQDRIARAAARAGRVAESVRLVVVTKGQTPAVLNAAIQAGARVLGENYVEEAVGKMERVGFHVGLEWHMIGHIQGRKVGSVVGNFCMIHSLDSLKLARRLDTAAMAVGRVLPVLLEINVGGEPTKSGWPAVDESHWQSLLTAAETILPLQHLKICGLMTVPPFAATAEESRGHFVRLRRLQERLARTLPQAGWQELSMGTSQDFEVAVEEGATFVRVGAAILGPRPA
jgi:hypothetical protein